MLEASRLARNNTDGYRLMEICEVVGTMTLLLNLGKIFGIAGGSPGF
jgi:hypothetical protein